VVVLQAGSEVTDRELALHAADQLATFEVPSKWWIRTEPLPVNTVAKVDKRLVREQWLEAGNLPPTSR
jgi:long-chain acyl-CoA synthetase